MSYFISRTHLRQVEEGDQAKTRQVPFDVEVRDPVADEARIVGSAPVSVKVTLGLSLVRRPGTSEWRRYRWRRGSQQAEVQATVTGSGTRFY